MKQIILIILGLLIAPSALSTTVHCSGETVYPPQVAHGTCKDGECKGSLPASIATSTGECANGLTFDATAKGKKGTLVGKCRNGELVAVGNAVNLEFTGSCSNQGTFKGTGFIRPQWIAGFCNENGTFSAAVNEWEAFVEGKCEAPAFD